MEDAVERGTGISGRIRRQYFVPIHPSTAFGQGKNYWIMQYLPGVCRAQASEATLADSFISTLVQPWQKGMSCDV
jgi:hypothetical protein